MIFSHSQFLQALGWATVNSFWQMAALWVVFVMANSLFSFSFRIKYLLSTGSVLLGFLLFVGTFCRFYFNSAAGFGALPFHLDIRVNFLSILNYVSIAYLLVLIIPAYKLFRNWRFLKVLREQELQKPDVQFKLFVQKTSLQLGIKRRISIFVSALVKSPVTIGYLKPMILLPIASANHLSTQQVEAILLHELVHIQRYDYVFNLIISTIHTLLYFNPFVQLFCRVAEEERENCCDLTVLQFGYDKISYAAALLKLQKLSVGNPVFALRAIGRKNLRSRIEKIVGIQPVARFRLNYLSSFTAAVVLIFGLNLLSISTRKNDTPGLSFNNWVNPFYFFQEVESEKTPVYKPKNTVWLAKGKATKMRGTPLSPSEYLPENLVTSYHPFALQAAYSSKLPTLERENQVEKTVEATKIVLETVQWKEIEKSIGDGLTDEEKLQAREEYMEQINQIDWNGLQTNLMAEYDQINWQRLNLDLKALLSAAAQDSLSAQSVLVVPEIIPSADSSTVNLSVDSAAHPVTGLPVQDSLKKSKNAKPLIKISL